MYVMVQDITTRKEAEQQRLRSEAEYRVRLETEIQERTAQLKESSELVQATLDSSLDMIQVFKAVRDNSGKIIDFVWIFNNPTSVHLYGNVIGKSLLEVNPGVVKEGIFGHFIEVTETGVAQQYEYHYVHEQVDGWFYQSVVKLNDGVATSTTDITSRKKAEQLLDRQREQQRSMLDTTLVQMSILEAIRGENNKLLDLKIKAVNKELEKETGRTDLVDGLYSAEYPGIHEAGIFELIEKAIETGLPQQMEYHYTHEGFRKWYACSFIKLGDGVVATNLDITERKMAEDERLKNLLLLEQSERLAKTGSWDYDLLTGVFKWSDGMYRLFDFEKGVDVSPEIYLTYVTDESRDAAHRVVDLIKKRQRPV
jgi:two-component system NarL family sensor kinase